MTSYKVSSVGLCRFAVNPANSSAIDLVEFVYDLDVDEHQWVPSLVETGLPLFDHGYGVVGATYVRPPEGGIPFPTGFHQSGGPPDLAGRVLAASTLANEEVLREINRSGVVTTLSEQVEHFHGLLPPLSEFQKHLAGAKDILALTAVDPNGRGMSLTVPLPEITRLTGRDRELWQMIGAHLVSGYRLHRSLTKEHEHSEQGSALPEHAEAVLDPKKFEVEDAIGPAKDLGARDFLREAAIHIDRARGRLRKRDPEQALELWRALVEGRWSLVDWFDNDGRRYVLAHANPPDLRDPRGLTERENQVCTYAALGESNKLISYRLGISQSQVSATLRSAMRKLGVQTRPQLVEKLRAFVMP
ncbi:MAG: LuxR C-terminal-related transcriptional regulator [Polyangiales bacterium]